MPQAGGLNALAPSIGRNRGSRSPGPVDTDNQKNAAIHSHAAATNSKEHRIVPYAKKIVLRSRWGYRPGLDSLVADFKRDGVLFVGVVGKDCDIIEDIIDELCIDDDSGEEGYALLTSSHVDGTIEEAVSFAQALGGKYSGTVEVVEF